jgi:hypothetical protein
VSAVAVRPDRPPAPGELLRAMFDAALDAADPTAQVPRALGDSWWTGERTVVVSAGTAAALYTRPPFGGNRRDEFAARAPDRVSAGTSRRMEAE